MFNAYTMHLLEHEDAVGTLLFIDKQRGVVEALIADGLLEKAEFALASDWRTSNELYAAVAAADLKTRVVSCEAVDLEIDGRLKRSLQETVTKFARNLRTEDGRPLVPETAVPGLVATLRNQLFSAIRPYLMLLKQIRALSPERVVVAALPSSKHAAIYQLLGEVGVCDRQVIRFSKGSFSTVQIQEQEQTLVDVPDRYRPHPNFEGNIGRDGDVLVIAHVKDDRSAAIILPLISGLQSRVSVTWAIPAPVNDSSLERLKDYFGVCDDVRIVKKGPGHSLCLLDKGVQEAIASAIALIRTDAALGQGGENRFIATLVVDGLKRSARMIEFARKYDLYCKECLSRVVAVVVSPCETLEASIAVENCHCLGIPTIEVQRGPIAKATIIAPPEADHILCIDDASKAVYAALRDASPHQLSVVGNVRQDVEIGRLEAVSEDVARRAVSGAEIVDSDRVVLLIGQPIDRQLMRSVALVVFKAAVELDDVFVVVKPHPEEDLSGRDIYRALADEVGLAKFAVDDTSNSIASVIASTYVATYYSSVGLEAVGLGRPVISINPFREPSPFDLAAIGLASPVSTAEDLIRLLQSQEGLSVKSSDGTQIYTDGRVKDRMVERVLEVIGRPSAPLNDGESILTVRQLQFRVTAVADERGPEAALSLLRQACQFSDKDRKWIGAYAELAKGSVEPALEGFSYRTLIDRTVTVPGSLEPWLGQKVQGRILVWAQVGIGIGAEIMHLGFLTALRPMWWRLHLICDDRLVPLVLRSFPGLAVQGRDEWERQPSIIVERKGLMERAIRRLMPGLIPDRPFTHHCSIMSLGWLAHKLMGTSKRGETYFKTVKKHSRHLRVRYATPSRRALIGISWKTGNLTKGRRNVPDLGQFIKALSKDDAQLVSLQHGATEEEITLLRRNGVIVDDAIDPVQNIPSLLDQVAAMDLVVSVPNSVVHFAGSVGVPTKLLVSQGMAPEWQTKLSARYWYLSVDPIYYNADNFDGLLRDLHSV